MARDQEQNSVNLNILRDTLLTFVARAGKGKDEVLQVLARETAATIATLLKQPLSDFGRDLAHNHRIQLTIELVPKSTAKVQDTATRKKSRSKTTSSDGKDDGRKQSRSRSK
jgi:ABC-type proline/glycine betaine transport system ATPase subunit